jgi:hypothetical protein
MVLIEQMKPIKQLSLAETGFLPKAGKQTRKAVFLAEMETVVPWSRLEALIEPFYPKKGNGRPPMPLGTMLRIHFMQQWFGYSDPAMEEALHDVPLLRRFAGLDAFEDVCRTKAPSCASGICWRSVSNGMDAPTRQRHLRARVAVSPTTRIRRGVRHEDYEETRQRVDVSSIRRVLRQQCCQLLFAW